MIKSKILEIVQDYNKLLSLGDEGLSPGNIVNIELLANQNQFLAKIIFTVQNAIVKGLTNTTLCESLLPAGIDGVYYSIAYYNYDKKRVVAASDFIKTMEFLPLKTYNIEWIVIPYTPPSPKE